MDTTLFADFLPEKETNFVFPSIFW